MKLLIAKAVPTKVANLLDYLQFGVRAGIYGSQIVSLSELEALMPRPLAKAVVRTPTRAGGGIKWKAVPAGASIWITVPKEGSPLHGRHILITKSPDGQFARTGAAGAGKKRSEHASTWSYSRGKVS